MIGGNISATVQICHTGAKNGIGERSKEWLNVMTIKGFLDYVSGESRYNSFNAKIEESSHLFICDYTEDVRNLCYLLDSDDNYIFDSDNCTIRTRTSADGENTESITSENSRMIINNRMYDIVFIDNPMELDQHYEIYLKAVGQ